MAGTAIDVILNVSFLVFFIVWVRLLTLSLDYSRVERWTTKRRAAKHVDNATRILRLCCASGDGELEERKLALLRSERYQLRWFRYASCAFVVYTLGIFATVAWFGTPAPAAVLVAFCTYLILGLMVVLTWELNNYIYPEWRAIQLCYSALAALSRCVEACDRDGEGSRNSASNRDARAIAAFCQNAPSLVARRSRDSNMPRLVEFNVGYSKRATDRIEDSFLGFLCGGNRKELERSIRMTLGLLDVFMGRPAPGAVPQSVEDKAFAKRAILLGVRRRRVAVASLWVALVSVPVVVAGIQWGFDIGANWLSTAVRAVSVVVPMILIGISAYRRYVQNESLTFSDVGKTAVLSRKWQS